MRDDGCDEQNFMPKFGDRPTLIVHRVTMGKIVGVPGLTNYISRMDLTHLFATLHL
jgi:hypothetical protein